MVKVNKSIFEKASGIKLDVGCGINKQKGFVGMDMVAHPHVDIVHDVQVFPWPLPDACCHQIVMSHLWEHIEPKYRFGVMEQLWRIIRHDGQLFISCPMAGSHLEAAHPAHYMCPNDATFQFFDPMYYLWHSCSYEKPSPWKIIYQRYAMNGCIEIILEPRKDKKGNKLMPDEKERPVIAGAIMVKPEKENIYVTDEQAAGRRNACKRRRQGRNSDKG